MQIPDFDVAEWYRRRTFESRSLDLEAAAWAKADQGLSVSVVLPAYNEAPTIGDVIDAVMSLAGVLVDEVVVLDGGSTDATPEVAADRGARVHTDIGAFPDLGPALGKGDALWRSLSVTSGDIITFVDTDIRNPSPIFVSGLVAPLITTPQIELVKAFYDRPIELNGTLHPAGGGRVTELLARPLLNLFWPELSGLVQPLSGEYAGRRELLESIPFSTGYGVEIGMLIDTLGRRGADAIAQVDIGQRIHRNQDITALSRMAFGVAQAALRRLPDAGRATFPDLPTAYRQFQRDADDTVNLLEAGQIEIIERPPMVEYRATAP
ncbi:glucosyl-3-phosphoglycerate synthase [Euzebya tangerina]|uniref:glucosyl-3-phosphoglycerate synthase n=1 Tax=Euzebya tangerina TaxID=591198 RepID=UPI000E324629|nr:glucosyl-3-phosphoglycerate synthase [Euzebya tangerina]